MKALKRLGSYLVCSSLVALTLLTASHATEAETTKVEVYFSETAQSVTDKVKENTDGISQTGSAFHYQIGPITTSGGLKLADANFRPLLSITAPCPLGMDAKDIETFMNKNLEFNGAD